MTIIGMVHGEGHVITGAAKAEMEVDKVVTVAVMEMEEVMAVAEAMVAVTVVGAVTEAEEIRDRVNRVYR